MLPPRRKEVLRNLLIYDSRENRLATVPSYLDGKEENIKKVALNTQRELSQIVSGLSESETDATKNPYFYIDSVLTLLNEYEDLYIPIVKLETSVKRKE